MSPEEKENCWQGGLQLKLSPQETGQREGPGESELRLRVKRAPALAKGSPRHTDAVVLLRGSNHFPQKGEESLRCTWPVGQGCGCQPRKHGPFTALPQELWASLEDFAPWKRTPEGQGQSPAGSRNLRRACLGPAAVSLASGCSRSPHGRLSLPMGSPPVGTRTVSIAVGRLPGQGCQVGSEPSSAALGRRGAPRLVAIRPPVQRVFSFIQMTVLIAKSSL